MSKKYYWIKLRTDFFNRDEIDFLLSQKNGCEYIVLYQMLCLMVANTNGKLIKEMNEIIIPYDINKIVRDTKHFSFDTVTVALELYKQLGLIYTDENGSLTISNYNDMIGSETSSAKSVREWRKKQKLLQCNYNVTQEIEYRDKSIDNRDIEIEKEKRKTFKGVIDSYTSYQPLKESLNAYVDMRKKMKGYTIQALELNLKELDKLAIDDNTKMAIVNQSISHTWKGFYELKINVSEPIYTSDNNISVNNVDLEKYLGGNYD